MIENYNINKSLPTIVALPASLLTIGLLIALVYLSQQILVPIIISFLIAILLKPLVYLMHIKMKFPQLLAILIALLLFICGVFGLLFFVYLNVLDIANDWSKIKLHIVEHFHNLQLWLGERFAISPIQQQSYFDKTTNELLQNGGRLVTETLDSFSNLFVMLLLIPVLVFLTLLYQTLFTKFLYQLVRPSFHPNLKGILTQIKTVVLSYIVGILIQMGIVAGLTSLGLYLLGIEYALLLGLITGILNLIPYIGIVTAFGIAVFSTLINTSELSNIAIVLIIFVVVQVIDNNFLVPKIVGTKVQINALASILGIIIGGMIAGIAGMFLALPVLAMIKVVFDHIPTLSPWGYLLGDDLVERNHGWQALRKRNLIK